jgi:hypothetical protein
MTLDFPCLASYSPIISLVDIIGDFWYKLLVSELNGELFCTGRRFVCETTKKNPWRVLEKKWKLKRNLI